VGQKTAAGEQLKIVYV